LGSKGSLDFSAPLNDSKTVKYRLNISYENYESFSDFVNGERFLVSPILTWDISPNTSIDFCGQYVSDRETTDEGLVTDLTINLRKTCQLSTSYNTSNLIPEDLVL
jgi:outer membrane receptor for ferric coprogen and ferric-rhodotorulic acid